MKIKISRHAKRRAKLYKIPETKILEIVEGKDFSQGIQEIIKSVGPQQYPLKIILAVEENQITIVTAYPLKRGLKK